MAGPYNHFQDRIKSVYNAETEEELRSLNENVQNAAGGRDRVDALNALAEKLKVRDVPRALPMAQEAKALATELGYTKGLASSLCTIGICLMDTDPAQAIASIKEARSLSQECGYRRLEAACSNHLGVLHDLRADYALAM